MSEFGKGNLLIAEDDILLGKQVAELLQDCTDNIYLASNGVEALALVESKTIHCILSDTSMPKMGGIEFIKELRSKKNLTPFIFFSGHGSKEIMNEVMPFGVLNFINKPHLQNLEQIVCQGLALGLEKKPSV